MSIAPATTEASYGDAAKLIKEMIEIADQAADKDQVVIAKLKIDVRKWVVETVLLKTESKKDGGAAESPISVTIGMDATA